ncbi:MAG: endopeptidase La [Bacteroidota bacterium]
MNFNITDYINLYLASSHSEPEQLDLPDTQEEGEIIQIQKEETRLPLLLLSDTVLFPEVFAHFALQDQATIKSIKKLYQKGGKVGVIAPKKQGKTNMEDLYPIGTQAQIQKIMTLPEGQTVIILQGECRFKVNEITKVKNQLIGKVELLQDDPIDMSKPKNQALIQSLKETTLKIFSLIAEGTSDIQMIIENIKNPIFLTYYVASYTLEFRHKQKLLVSRKSVKRASLLLSYLMKNLEFTKLKKKIQHQAHTDIDKQQREIYIRQQIKALQQELGEVADIEDELEELEAKGKKQKWALEIKKHFEKTIQRAYKTHSQSPEYGTILNYAHILTDMPWNIHSKDNHNLQRAEKILNEQHYGMEKVKERILEFLAIHIMAQKRKGPILCLVGPPGVGKTSLCQSIAKALGRKYLRISLGGVHDESELRGHRKTYVGAMLGKVLNLIKDAGTSNPVFVLDEIDKLDSKRGDPASALLEILDPNQNQAFVDNFLEVPFDLSQVLFIATANDRYQIPWALDDRMEFIKTNGYAIEEKVQIAQKYLIPEQRKIHGLKANQLSITDQALVQLIQNYTSESGVRELTRQIATINRKTAKKIVTKATYSPKILPKDLNPLLGPEKYDLGLYEHANMPGVATGLAWTSVGGEILFIEAVLTKGEGKLTISGQLGEVMEESATAAYTYLKSQAKKLKIDYRIFQTYDLHIHIPDGATPKDGPSAGITIYTTLASLYTQKKLKPKTAMTGEITLRGNVLPVGGIKEKILAAKRAGIQQIILSKKNQKDVTEIKPEYVKALNLHYVNHVDQLLPIALEKAKVAHPQKWDLTQQPNKKYPL